MTPYVILARDSRRIRFVTWISLICWLAGAVLIIGSASSTLTAGVVPVGALAMFTGAVLFAGAMWKARTIEKPSRAVIWLIERHLLAGDGSVSAGADASDEVTVSMLDAYREGLRAIQHQEPFLNRLASAYDRLPAQERSALGRRLRREHLGGLAIGIGVLAFLIIAFLLTPNPH